MTKVLVVGGGLGGLATSVILARAELDVELVEQQDQLRTLGSGITVVGPALRALDQIGVLDQCLANGFGTDEWRMCGLDGEVRHTFTLPQLLGPERPGQLGIMRPALHTVLLEAALEAGVNVRTGTTLDSITTSDDTAEVGFVGEAPERFDLVVGADGGYSTVRQQLFGNVEMTFEGRGCFRAVLPRPEVVDVEYIFEGHPTVHPGFTPIGPDKMYMFSIVPDGPDSRPRREELPGLMQEGLKEFGGLAAWARDQIVDPDLVDYRLLYSLLTPSPWNVGRAVLVGDAAHHPTPQLGAGGAMALEDAVVLGEEMQAAEFDIPLALRRFSERRFERCRFVVESSSTLNEWQSNPDTPGADRAKLSEEAFARLAEPA